MQRQRRKLAPARSFDEMWTYQRVRHGEQRPEVWLWTAVIELPGGRRCVDFFEVGDRSSATFLRRYERLPEAEWYYRDDYAVYRAWLPAERHIVGKGVQVNRNEGLHSEWRGRQKRLMRETTGYTRAVWVLRGFAGVVVFAPAAGPKIQRQLVLKIPFVRIPCESLTIIVTIIVRLSKRFGATVERTGNEVRPPGSAPRRPRMPLPDRLSKMGVCDSIATSPALQPDPSSPVFPDLRDLRYALDRIDPDELVAALEGPPCTGRRVCARRPILRAYLASYFLGIDNISALICRLNNDPALRCAAGFASQPPSYATFWGVFDRLAGMTEVIDRCCDDVLDQLRKLLPDLGREVSVDSTTIEAFANPNRKDALRNPGGPADPDASWTKKNSARDPTQQEWVFGYKAHTVADANHDIPLGMMVTPASRNDSPLLQPLLEDLEQRHAWFSMHNGAVVIADRGYDSRLNNGFVHRNGGVPVIHKRQPAGGRLHDGIYTKDGVPTYLGQQEMVYIRTDPATGWHLYRCPASGCARRGKVHGVSTCDDDAWEDPERDIRLFGGRIRRGSPEWQDMYAKRWSGERVFSHWKDPGQLEKHRCFGLRQVSAHARLQMLMSLTTALVKELDDAAAV